VKYKLSARSFAVVKAAYNILRADFILADPKSAKKDIQVISHFALLGSASVKAAHKHVDEIGLNFINVLHTAFTCADTKSVKRY